MAAVAAADNVAAAGVIEVMSLKGTVVPLTVNVAVPLLTEMPSTVPLIVFPDGLPP